MAEYDLTPVDGDPFAASAGATGYDLTPVSGDPFKRSRPWWAPEFAPVSNDFVQRVVGAFGHGFAEGVGPQKFGISKENWKTLQELGYFRKDDERYNPFKALNEIVGNVGVALLETPLRAGGGLLGAYQKTVYEITGSRDLAAAPEAFFGMPHPTGTAKPPEMTRLYRVEAKDFKVAEVADWVKESPEYQKMMAATGRWFAADAENVAWYMKFSRDNGVEPKVTYVDVPTATAEKYRISNLEDAEVKSFSRRPEEEFFLPRELADQRKDLAEAPRTPDFAQARDLGVIGPERPRVSEGTPEQAAARTVAADRVPDERITQEVGEGVSPWRERFEHFVGKLDKPEDVKQIIRNAADENNEFPAAREGEIPLRQVEDLAAAAGVAPSEINVAGIGRLLQNDAQVRVAMHAMLTATEQVKEAARAVEADASPANLQKLQEAMLRRDMWVEQIVGLRAEWGRTGNVFQEFMRDVKDQQSLTDFLQRKGRTPEDLRDLARGIGQLDRESAARVLNDARINQPGKIFWIWVQGLISGLHTHAKYMGANALYRATETGITTPIAALIGQAKRVLGAGAERVYFGEGAAGIYGLMAAVPGAVIGTARSIKAGMRLPLESERSLADAYIARGERVPTSITRSLEPALSMQRPIAGVWGRILGAPGDMAMAIHTFFKIIGERAALESLAYREAAKEGHSPTEAAFWDRRSDLASNPTEKMRKEAIEDAYKGTFMQELGPHGKKWQNATKSIPGLKWVFPFSHIPLNLMKATYEHTPFAFLDKTMREDIMGKNGGVAQDKAIARMVVGSAIMAYFTNEALNGRMTGDLPHDPKERDQWKLLGKQPNSILINNTWVSLGKFGPAGNLANLSANIAYVIPHLTSHDDDAMTKATHHAAHAAARIVIDEVGMLSLQMIFEAIQDEKKGASWVSRTASSFLPYSSLISQTASAGLPFTGTGGDPYMREAKGFIDGIKYRIPGLRETLLPKRDWSGQPVENPAYGNILRQRPVNMNPVDLEMARLGIHPAAPVNRISGIELTPALYDKYQTIAGAFTRTTLESLIAQPGWDALPAYARESVFRETIKHTRASAAAVMQMTHPEIVRQGLDNRIRHIEGQKQEKKLKEPTP